MTSVRTRQVDLFRTRNDNQLLELGKSTCLEREMITSWLELGKSTCLGRTKRRDDKLLELGKSTWLGRREDEMTTCWNSASRLVWDQEDEFLEFGKSTSLGRKRRQDDELLELSASRVV